MRISCFTLSSYGQIKGLKCTGKWLSMPYTGLRVSVYNITNQFDFHSPKTQESVFFFLNVQLLEKFALLNN